MSLMRTDHNQIVTGDLALEGLTAIDRLAPLVVPKVELKTNPVGAFPVYDNSGRLLGWVPVFDANPPYEVPVLED